MAFIHGRNAVVLWDEINIGQYCNNVDLPSTMEVHETTVFGKKSKTYVAGMKDSTLSLGGFWDGAANAADVTFFNSLSNTSNPPNGKVVTVAPEGMTRGNQCVLFSAYSTSYSSTTPVGDVVTFSLDAQGGAFAGSSVDESSGIRGVSLHDLTAVTATGNDTSVDNGASTANGIVAQLHVTAVTAIGGDSLAVDVADSADNTTFADKINFTSVTTSTTKERKSATGTINRYLRVEKTKGGAGAPSWTIAVAVARL